MKTTKTTQVGNFEKLVSFANAQGPVYKPSEASIQLAALQTLLTQAQGAIQAAHVSRSAYEDALNAREDILKNVPRLATAIVMVMKANRTPANVLEDVLAIRRTLSGVRKRKNVTTADSASGATANAPEPTVPKRRSQLDVDAIISNFSLLVTRVAAQRTFVTDDAELQVPALQAMVATLREKNAAVVRARQAKRMSDNAVDELLYTDSGIHGSAVAAKAYFAATFGFRSPQHKQLTALQFRKD